MATTTTRPDSVDVADMMRQTGTDVAHEAREQFAARLRAYRQGVASMAENEGRLPADEAAQLLAVCRDLGIPVERLNTDVVVTIRHSRLAAAVAAVMSKAEQQASVVAELKAALDAESMTFFRVKSDCDQRVRAAEATLREVKARHDEAAAIRPERVDEKQTDMARLRNEAPHLFRDDIDAESLRRLVS